MESPRQSSSSSSQSITESGLFARVILGAVALLSLILLMIWCWPRSIQGSGGVPIPGEIIISTPQFFQGDKRWGDDFLGLTPGTLAAEGCAVSSVSMVLSSYGMDVDPGRLNKFLTENNGYEGSAWLRWESAALFMPGLVEKAYEDLPSYARIDWNLLSGNPVIVRVRLPDGITHFVVIVGKRGFDYLIRDPASSLQKDYGMVYPFRLLGVPMEALRYYRRLR
jgi:hypothetical protein